jgi:hypothetical protein
MIGNRCHLRIWRAFIGQAVPIDDADPFALPPDLELSVVDQVRCGHADTTVVVDSFPLLAGGLGSGLKLWKCHPMVGKAR